MSEKVAVVGATQREAARAGNTSPLFPAVVFTKHISLTTKLPLKYSRKLRGNEKEKIYNTGLQRSLSSFTEMILLLRNTQYRMHLL